MQDMLSYNSSSSHDDHHAQVASLVHTMYPLLGAHPMMLINACFTLTTLGQLSLILLISTLLFSNSVRRRNATLINLLAVTILCGVPPALLYYAGGILNPRPPIALCFAQAILKHGSDTMFAVASFALVVEFLQGTGIVVMKFLSKRHLRVPVLIAMPYITFTFFAVLTAGLGAAHTKKIVHKSSSTYCTVDFAVYTHSVEIFSVLVVLFIISLEVYTLFKLRRNWDGLNRADPTNSFGVSQALRVAGFTILQLNYLILCGIDFYFKSVGTHVLPLVYESLMPLATFFIFGTTYDCLQAWICCCRCRKPEPKPVPATLVTLPPPPTYPSIPPSLISSANSRQSAVSNEDNPPKLPPKDRWQISLSLPAATMRVSMTTSSVFIPSPQTV